MYTLFSNEKLGVPVEELRLREIRQQIEAQRLGDEINPTLQRRITRFLYGALHHLKLSTSKLTRNKAQYDRAPLR